MSNEIKYSDNIDYDYENFYAECPYCGFKNIFNRATDLKTFSPISFKQVRCFSDSCNQYFNINGDRCSEAYETLLFDATRLFNEKKYSICILLLTQAYEVFFSLVLNLKLVLIPFNDDIDELKDLNDVNSLFFNAIKRCTFFPLRNLFINSFIMNLNPKDLIQSKNIIQNTNKYCKNIKKECVEVSEDPVLEKLLLELYEVKIAELRNKVAHKVAYRPTKKEAEACLNETRTIIFRISRVVKVTELLNTHYY